MKRKLMWYILSIGVLGLLAGCAGTQTPVTSDIPVTSVRLPDSKGISHCLLWYGGIKVDTDTWQVEIIPARGPLTHFNIRTFTEDGPCTDCLAIKNFHVLPDDIFSLDVQITHPFPGIDNFTGFDVKGIVIFNGSKAWTATDVTVPDSSLGDGELLNPDGYTRLYNPVEFPPGSLGVGLWEYSKGALAPPGLLSGSLNGYRDYQVDTERRMFETTATGLAHFEIKKPEGPFLFGYAVDAGWLKPDPALTGDPLLIDVPGDFSLEANCPEAYNLSTSATPGLIHDGSGKAEIFVDVYDWQMDAVSATAQVECPDLFYGLLPLDVEFTGTEYVRFSGDVYNSLAAPVGEYEFLVSVRDVTDDQSPLPLIAYEFGIISVTESYLSDPIAIADFDPCQMSICEDIFFFDNGSYDPDGGDIVLYEWDWDNDDIFDEDGPEVWHSWNAPGDYPVQFRVTDDEGATDILDVPLSVVIPEPVISQPQLIVNITDTFHSPFCAKVDTQENSCYVDCTQASPVLDFGFYRIDENEFVTKDFEKFGSGFFGMPGMFGLNVEARKIIAPDILGAYPGTCPIDVWDLDGGPDLDFGVPIEEEDQLAFCMDAELFKDLETGVVCDMSPAQRLVYFNYLDDDPEMISVPTNPSPNMIEADYDGHRLFVFCAGGSNPTVQVFDAVTWTVIHEIQTINVSPPFMSEIDFDPCLERLYFGCGTDSLEIWDAGTCEFIGEIHTGYGEVKGVDHMGGGIYVTAGEGAGHLLVYNAFTLELVWDIDCGQGPAQLACNPNNGKIYVPDMNGQTVFVFQG